MSCSPGNSTSVSCTKVTGLAWVPRSGLTFQPRGHSRWRVQLLNPVEGCRPIEVLRNYVKNTTDLPSEIFYTDWLLKCNLIKIIKEDLFSSSCSGYINVIYKLDSVISESNKTKQTVYIRHLILSQFYQLFPDRQFCKSAISGMTLIRLTQTVC